MTSTAPSKYDTTATLYGNLYAVAKKWVTVRHPFWDADEFADAYATVYAGTYSCPTPTHFAATYYDAHGEMKDSLLRIILDS